MIPSNITREHVERAIRELEEVGVPASRASMTWAVSYKGKRYPPKYVLSVANRFANGADLPPDQFAAGDGPGAANPFLRGLGFEVVAVDDRAERAVGKPTTEDDVGAAFEGMFPNEEVRHGVLRFLADSIEEAAKHGAAKWVCTLRSPRKVNLTVGRAYVASIQSGVLHVPVDSGALDEETERLLGATTTRADEGFASLPGSATYTVPAEQLPAVRSLLAVARSRFIERAAGAVKQTPYAYAHTQVVVDYLAKQLGRTLPHPEYSPVARPITASARSWIFEANPKRYDLKGALARLRELNWQVNQHIRDIHAGDAVYLWLSGEGGGLLARGTLTAEPGSHPPRPDEAPFALSGDSDEDNLTVPLVVDKLLASPITRAQLLSYPELDGLGFLQAPQGTNFAVTEEQASLIEKLIAGEQPKRAVKIAPGEAARFWKDCVAGGYICIGWDEVGDLTRFESFADFRKAFAERCEPGKPTGHVTRKARELWKLRELQRGDLVVANQGIDQVLGVGTVVGPYRFLEERGEYRHSLPLQWDTSLAKRIPPQPGWALKTVDAVSGALLDLILASTPTPASALQPARFESVRGGLRDAGLAYSDEVLSHYLLALQTKRFVILTGISGTGKTQLALAVAKHFPARVTTRRDVNVPEEATPVRVSPYMLKYSRLALPAALRDELDGLDLRQLEISADGRRFQARARLSQHNGALYLYFKADFRDWFRASYAIGDTMYLLPRLEGPSPVLEVVRPSVEQTTVDSPSYEVISVRPDWTDSRSLLGFYNPIIGRYELTAFLRLLLRARDEEERAARESREPAPFFAILDEMNLARVEHYFADFLSAMESGEPIALHERDALESGEETQDSAETLPQRLVVPSNLFFTGTVNVDETTHMFSPKVLDRAFVLELHDVDLAAHGAAALPASDLRLSRFPGFVAHERPDTDDWLELGKLDDGSIRQQILDLHSLLGEENRHFGYRVANEIARFVTLAAEQADASERQLAAAFDLALFSKVLPKLHGTTQELRSVLEQLFGFCVHGKTGVATQVDAWRVRGAALESRASADGAPLPQPLLPRSAAKVWRMWRRVQTRGFTSFIE